MMDECTVTLRQDDTWVLLRPIDDTRGVVLAGTVYSRGDVLEIDDLTTWREAAEEDGEGNTMVTPFDLEVHYDAVTGWRYLRRAAGEDELAAVEDPLAARAYETVDFMVDAEEELVRRLEELLRDEAEEADVEGLRILRGVA